MVSNVIQGCFPHGLPRFDDRSAATPPPAAAQVVARAPHLIAQPFQGRQVVARAVQPRAIWPQPNPGIVQFPARLESHPSQRPVPAPPQVAQRRPANGNSVRLPAYLSGFPRHGGQPLPADVRQMMEAVFGKPFADVRVHVGGHASSIRAVAFTNGSNLYFAPGQYHPQTPQGLRMLAHELSHVVQQRAGLVRNPYGADLAVVHDAGLEAEAERMGHRAYAAYLSAQRNSVARAATTRAPAGAAQPKSAFFARPRIPARAVIQRALDYDKDTEQDDLCGGFQRKITWKLTGNDIGPGMILQHVTKTFSVREVNANKDMTIGEIETYVKDNDGGNDITKVVDYWEAWDVPQNTTAPKDPDYFMVPCIFKNRRATKDSTKGKIVMKGEAFWYPGVDVTTLGMKQDKDHPSAGLHYSDNKPGINTSSTSSVTRTYTAEWDSTKVTATKGEYGKTKVTLT